MSIEQSQLLSLIQGRLNEVTNDIKIEHVLNELKPVLVNKHQMDQFEIIMTNNERYGRPKLDSLSDLEVIYCFVHQDTHIDEEDNRTLESNKEYLRDLLQFYMQLHVNKTFIQEDVVGFKEGSLFKNLHPRHVTSYHNWLKEGVNVRGKEGYSKSTRRRKVAVIKSFLRWLYENDYIELPLHGAFKREKNKSDDFPKRDLSYQEVRSLIDYYDDHPINSCLIVLLATTGLRIREIANARFNDLYYNSSVGGFYLQVIGKGNVPRRAYIMGPTLQRIKEFRECRGFSHEINPNDDSPLLPNRQRDFYNYKYLSNYVVKIIKAAGESGDPRLEWIKHKEKQVSPHWFRHYFVTISEKKANSLSDVQRSVGHKSRSTTERYLQKDYDDRNNVGLLWDEEDYV
ncbi:tyrosine-type recombinase/integrase [Desertibacillus haloalkaliphilus]|uniref:tyrosine-type recombinase/integrase n=1 Tax=Desertibacillus haloalkaliphilus TaxID=1328930 RepID=UPI001C278623|nr:site-specific integrase [Desertibacillus haloalkaliphilus]MBU8908265.1 site-specific integrase [Desertibacillus haloalkaliphilus]